RRRGRGRAHARHLPAGDRPRHGSLRRHQHRRHRSNPPVSEWTNRMIKDPPLLTISRNFPRPSASDVAAFAGVPTGYAVDAMAGRGALDYRIKPLAPASAVLVGAA